MSRPYLRFKQVALVAVKAQVKEQRDRMIHAAYIGWQMGAGGEIPFGAYLDRLKLTDKEPVKVPTKEEALQIAASVLERLKGVEPSGPGTI